MISDAILRLPNRWKDSALKIDREAESESGLKRERLLAMAQTLYECGEELRRGLRQELLDTAEQLSKVIMEDGEYTPEDINDLERFRNLRLPGTFRT